MLEIIKPELPFEVRSELVNHFRTEANQIEQYNDIPDFIIGDIFNSYNTPYEEMKYELDDTQYWWYDMLQGLNSYLLKTVTQNKGGYSFIALKHAMKLLAKIIQEEQNESDPTSLDGSGKNPSQSQQNRINDKIKDGMQQLMEDTSKEIQKVQDIEEMIGDGGGAASKGPSELKELENKADYLKNVILNKKSVSRFITKSIKGFKRGFGVKTIVTEEDLFDSSNIEEILDEHYLFNEFLFADIAVRDTTAQMTAFDLYIDISGSMSSSIQLKDGALVQRLKLAVSLALKMNQMKCLGQIYKFNTLIFPIENEDLWKLHTSGGTHIENVMQMIKKTGRPSVILTDGEDTFWTYSENAFLMSIINPHEYRLNDDLTKRMIKAKKYIIYKDGDLIIPKLKGEKMMS